MTEPKVTIYCDGACLGNPGPGGFAALLMLNKSSDERVVSGFELATTNNRMELKAAIAGLAALKKKCRVELFSDSQYVVKGMNEWIHNWQRSQFKGANKKDIANVDLWKELVAVSQNHLISWKWVRGHAGNEFNERVDEIAREQAGLALHTMHQTR